MIDKRLVSGLRLQEFLGVNIMPGCPQRVGLGLAASFGNRFREVGEQHGEPKPRRDGRK